MTELWIDKYRIELQDTRITQTFQVNDLAEVKDRQANYTNRFKIPLTPNNTKVFGYLGVVGNLSRKQYKNLSAKLVYNGVEVVSDGSCYIKATTPTYYEVVIYSGNISLFDSIKDKSIRDLDFTDLNHSINFANISNSIDNTEGYIYPMFVPFTKQENLIHSWEMRVNTMLPFVFEKTILNKIMSEAGFSFSGIDGLGIEDTVIAPYIGITQLFWGEGSSNQQLLNQYYSIDNNRRFTLTSTGAHTKEHTYVIHSFTAVESGYYKFRAQGNANSVARHIINGTSYNQVRQDQENVIVRVGSQDYELYPYFLLSGSFDEEETIYIDAGQNVSIFYWMKSSTGVTSVGLGNGTNYFDLTIESTLTLTIDLLVNELYANFNSILPDIRQTDFIKEVMWRFGLSLKRERNSNHYTFRRLEDIFKDRNNAVDWSENFNQTISEQYKIGSYTKANYFKYIGEDDYTGFADGIITVDNETLSDERTLITSQYAAQVPSTKYREESGTITPLEYLPYYKIEYDSETGANNFQAENEIPPKVFKIWRSNLNWSIVDLSGNFQTISGDIPLLSFDDLYWQGILNQNYNALKRTLDDALLLKASFYFDAIDIYKLDFFRLVYLKQYGAYFYLNKVQNFQLHKLTKCELLRVSPDVLDSGGGYGYGVSGAINNTGFNIIGTF